MNILIKFSYLLQIISGEEGKKKKLEGINFENILVKWSPSPGQSLRSLLLTESSGVEEHPEDNDLTE